MIENTNIGINEKNWIETILSKDFPDRKQVIEQINNSKIHREYTDYYVSLKFEVDKQKVHKIQTNIRVPIEMRVYKSGQIPMQFLLHIIHGYVSELEIFNADSSKIENSITLEDVTIEIIINTEI